MLAQEELLETSFEKFSGMNRSSDRLTTPPGFYYDLLNGYCKKDIKSGQGFIIQRNGCSKLNSTVLSSGIFGSTTKIRTLFEAKWDGGSVDVIIRAGTAWGIFDGVNSFTGLDTGRSDDVYGQCVMFQNQLLMVDGGIPRKCTSAYTVSNLSADANMPQDSTAIWVHRDKVWLNSQANPMIAYFCTTNSANGATSWTGTTDAGTINLSTILPEGDTIVGFRSVGGYGSNQIAIICRKYTVVFQATSNVYNFQLVQYFPTTCASINATDYLGTDLVYPSLNSFTSLALQVAGNNLEVKSLSDYIQPLWRSTVALFTDTTQIAAGYDKTLNLFYVTFPTSSSPQIFVYSIDVGNFVGRYTYPFTVYSFKYRLSGQMLMGADGYVYIMNTGTSDDGTAISFKYASPAYYLGTASRYKKPIEFEALFQNTANLTAYLDYWYGLANLATDLISKEITLTASSSPWDTSLWDVSYWDASGNNLFKTADLLGRGKLMFIEIRHSTLDSLLAMAYYIVRYKMEGTK